MKLGILSVSLNVKGLNKSKEFYENLGFSVFGGDLEMNYLIMKNEIEENTQGPASFMLLDPDGNPHWLLSKTRFTIIRSIANSYFDDPRTD